MLAACAQHEVDHAPLEEEIISDVARFERLQGEWNALLESQPPFETRRTNSIFLTWEWLFTWWKHLAEGRRLSIIALRRAGELIAIAPLSIAPPSAIRARPFSSIQFLGTGHAGSDYLDVIVRPGHELAAEELLANRIESLRLPVEWAQVERGASSAARVAQKLNQAAWSAREIRTNVCPYIRLAGHSWDSYLATLGGEHRYDFRRKWRRLNQDHAVEFEQASTIDECRQAIEIVMKLHHLRWRDRGGSDAFHTPALADFHREWSRVALDRGWLRLYILRVDGVPAAALYGFQHGKIFYYYQAGFDPAYGKFSVGSLIIGLAIQRAIEEGVEEYDLLHGDEEYKSHWSSAEREIGRIEIDPPGFRGWISQSALSLARNVKQIRVMNWLK